MRGVVLHRLRHRFNDLVYRDRQPHLRFLSFASGSRKSAKTLPELQVTVVRLFFLFVITVSIAY
jgi:hypothetical protein